HDRAPPSRGERHPFECGQRDTSFPKSLEQSGRSNPPFVTDEHGVGLELPSGLKTGQYVTHAAHRMRHKLLRPSPSRPHFLQFYARSTIKVSVRPARQPSSSRAHVTERYAPTPMSARLRRLSVPG